MDKKILLSARQIELTTKRICHQLAEIHDDFKNSVILGLQPRGVFFADKLAETIKSELGIEIPKGYLDVTFHRDDFRRGEPLIAQVNDVPFLVENKKVILVDDVFFTGRTIRAALDAIQAFGRPSKVELAVLIERKYAKELPIHPTYVGKSVNSMQSQKVKVEWKKEFPENTVWLINDLEK